MTATEISALVARELNEFRSEAPPPAAGLLGRPFSEQRIREGPLELMAALITPYPVMLIISPLPIPLPKGAKARRTAKELPLPPTKQHEGWVVANASGQAVVVYDAVDDEYALAYVTGEGAAEDINVRGDLVGTFLSA